MNGQQSSRSQLAVAAWDNWGQVIGNWRAYLSLAISRILSMIRPGQAWATRAETAIGVAMAAGWVFGMFTRVPEPRRAHSTRMFIYFTGLLAIASVLMAHQMIFFIFTITGFFHAAILRPWPLMVLGVGITS